MIPVFIPYVNRPDLLKRAIDSVPVSDRWKVVVINNSGLLLPDDIRAESIFNATPLTFSQTQNLMLDLAKSWIEPKVGVPFYLFLHSDAAAGEGTFASLTDMAYSLCHQSKKWGVVFTAYDALAAFNTEAFTAIGGWDEKFTWYKGECDAYHRLRLAGYPTIDSGLPVQHDPSQTLKADPSIAAEVNREFAGRNQRYLLKWGGDVGSERFEVPFNGEDREKYNGSSTHKL